MQDAKSVKWCCYYLWFKEGPGEVLAAVLVDGGGRQVGW